MPRLPELPTDDAQEMRTERLILVPMLEEHAQAMFPLLQDESLYAFTGGSPPVSVESLAATYLVRESRRSRDGAELWFNWMMWDRRLHEAVGYVQATVYPTHADIAWVVGKERQGQGYASEAARAMVAWLFNLGVAQVTACVHPDHGASQRVAGHAGLLLTNRMVDGEQVWALRAP
jgi:RimJ/RimL family protein N-acetyltransferase